MKTAYEKMLPNGLLLKSVGVFNPPNSNVIVGCNTAEDGGHLLIFVTLTDATCAEISYTNWIAEKGSQVSVKKMELLSKRIQGILFSCGFFCTWKLYTKNKAK